MHRSDLCLCNARVVVYSWPYLVSLPIHLNRVAVWASMNCQHIVQLCWQSDFFHSHLQRKLFCKPLVTALHVTQGNMLGCVHWINTLQLTCSDGDFLSHCYKLALNIDKHWLVTAVSLVLGKWLMGDWGNWLLISCTVRLGFYWPFRQRE